MCDSASSSDSYESGTATESTESFDESSSDDLYSESGDTDSTEDIYTGASDGYSEGGDASDEFVETAPDFSENDAPSEFSDPKADVEVGDNQENEDSEEFADNTDETQNDDEESDNQETEADESERVTEEMSDENPDKDEVSNEENKDTSDTDNKEGSDSEEAAEREAISEKSEYSDEVNDHISSVDELEVYQNAGLKEEVVDGRTCLVRDDIDMDYVDPKTGCTNRELMEKGRAPIDAKTGETIELHHIGQEYDSPLAELTANSEHGELYSTLHTSKTDSWRQDGTKANHYNVQRSNHWKERAKGD